MIALKTTPSTSSSSSRLRDLFFCDYLRADCRPLRANVTSKTNQWKQTSKTVGKQMFSLDAITTLLYIPVHSIPSFSVNVPSIKKYHWQHCYISTATSHLFLDTIAVGQSACRVFMEFDLGGNPSKFRLHVHWKCVENGRASLVVFLCLALMVRAHHWGKMYFQGLLRTGLENQGLWVFFVAQLLFSRCVFRGFHVYVRDPRQNGWHLVLQLLQAFISQKNPSLVEECEGRWSRRTHCRQGTRNSCSNWTYIHFPRLKQCQKWKLEKGEYSKARRDNSSAGWSQLSWVFRSPRLSLAALKKYPNLTAWSLEEC